MAPYGPLMAPYGPPGLAQASLELPQTDKKTTTNNNYTEG